MNHFIELESQMFVVNTLLKEMREFGKKGLTINSHLILGDRGVGKTTILKLLEHTIYNDKELKSAYNLIFVPTFFHGIGNFKEVERLIESIDVKDIKKHHILIIDDLDLFLSDSENDAHSLRELLIRDVPKVALIATAHSSFSDKLGASKALYGFFSQHKLEGATSNDTFTLLGEMLNHPQWTKLNGALIASSTFWVMNIAGESPRLLTVLKNVFYALNNRLSDSSKPIDPAQFLDFYFELAGPSFRNELMELPRYSRYFLEEASFCGHYFKIREVSLDISNPAREATKLVQMGYLKKNLEGEYAFTNKPMKAWLRFMKQIPLGKVLNVDLPVERQAFTRSVL